MTHHSRAEKAGLPPGSLVHLGERRVDRVSLTLVDYTAERISTRFLDSPGEAAACLTGDSVSWLAVTGLHDVPVLEELGKVFGIHPLVLEDILNTDQRPKVECFDDYLFLVARIPHAPADDSERIELEQVSIIVGAGFLITFQERPGDVFTSVRDRLQNGRVRLRNSGPDYLAHSLLDAIVDRYFLVLDLLAVRMDRIEEMVLDQSDRAVSHRIHRLRHKLIEIRNAVRPLRDMAGSLVRDEPFPFQPGTLPFLRDLHDHSLHVFDSLETHREVLSALLDLHFSVVNSRMSEVMKVLTIIATIFIPLTLVAGIYGMNFQFMPELGWRWGYPAVLAFMLAVAGGLLLYFRSRKWI